MFKRIGLAVALGAALLVTGCNVDPAPVQPAEGAAQESAQPQAQEQIKLTARVVTHRPDEFTTGGPFTCVEVKITNNSQGAVTAGAEHVAITGTDGTKRLPTLLVDAREMATVMLAPGENAKGVVCAEGKFTPETITFDDWGQSARAQVAR